MRCICIKKSDGKQCTYNAKSGSRFCGVHKNCANTVATGAAAAPVARAPRSQVMEPVPSYMNAKAPALPRGQVGVRTKKWGDKKPKTAAQRRSLRTRCGDKCYLAPEDLKYPVCATDGDCNYDCDGIRAARNVTYLINNRSDVSDEAKSRALRARDKAQRLGVEHCGWA